MTDYITSSFLAGFNESDHLAQLTDTYESTLRTSSAPEWLSAIFTESLNQKIKTQLTVQAKISADISMETLLKLHRKTETIGCLFKKSKKDSCEQTFDKSWSEESTH